MSASPFFAAYIVALIALLLLTAALAWQFRRRERQWKADLKRLADIKYAIDQAAIVATTSGRPCVVGPSVSTRTIGEAAASTEK